MRRPWRLRWVDKNRVDVTHVACGNGFSLIAASGTLSHKAHQLFGTGINTDSQVGVHQVAKSDYLKYVIQPARIDLPFTLEQSASLRILDVACGRAHSVVLTNHGIVTFGNNSYGQCARPIVDNEEYSANPAVVQEVSKHVELESGDDQVVAVKAGQDHTCLLTQHGHVYTCGWSADGQLGQNIYTLNWKPTRVGGELKGVRVKQIETRGDFNVALSDEGELFGWGNNEYSQLAMTGTREPQLGEPRHLKVPAFVKRPIVSVAVSGTHCMALDSNNQVWVWGYGLLGRGPKCEETKEPLNIPETLFGRYKELAHTMTRKIRLIKCGLNSSAVGLDDGSLYMWGKNRYGSLGLGEKIDAYFPLRVTIPASAYKIDCGPDHTFAICKTFL